LESYRKLQQVSALGHVIDLTDETEARSIFTQQVMT
jgi:hypothetical protein